MRVKVLIGSVLLLMQGVNAYENHDEDPHFVWFEADGLAVMEDGVYADSNKGMLKLNVVEFDRVNNRYKVLCSCKKWPGMDFTDALGAPCEGTAEHDL